MKLLTHTKISAKIIALLVLLGAITLFVAWNGSRVLMKSDGDYTVLTDSKLPASAYTSRAHQRMTGILYNAYKAVVFDGEPDKVREAAKRVEADYTAGLEMVANGAKADPSNTLIPRVRADLEKIHEITRKVMPLALADNDEAAARVLDEADVLEADTSGAIRAGNSALLAEAIETSAKLSVETASTSTMLYVVAIGSVLGAIAVALATVKFGITGPLSSLEHQMGEIAGGDYAKDVAGIERGDEVGAMAKAVRVFRENGIAKKAADEAKARADTEQQMVVTTVASHLSELSDGDLTTQIKADFPGDYAALKTNFNEALGKLRELIGSVSESAATIRTGSGEIAQASEDLARRTESNAASLEETAASVTQMDGRLKASAVAATRTVERADQAIATV
ncbi:MAG TPA: methyl-accepting chemotaxis protein, partial [Allosphingosinicella sp.]